MQTAAALALNARYMRMKGSISTSKLFERKAKAAYAYAKAMDSRNSGKAACSRSSANTNCVGDCGDASLSVRSAVNLQMHAVHASGKRLPAGRVKCRWHSVLAGRVGHLDRYSSNRPATP